MNKNASLSLSEDQAQLDLTRLKPDTSNNEYVALKQLIKKRGLLDKQPAYYTFRIALLLGLFTLGLVFFLVVHNSWLQLLNAVYLAFVFTQIGLLGHEAGHRQMFHRSWKHDLIGLVGGNLLVGMSYSWWMDKHNRHHSNPNQVDMDPDIEIPFLEFTGKEDLQTLGKFRQFLIKRQAYILFPALMIVSAGLQYNSVAFLLRNKPKYIVLEWVLLGAHFLLYFALVFAFLSIWQALLFILIHQALTGFYLGSIFAPNHKGMPVLDRENKMGFLQRQVLTARNIYTHPVTDFWYGGLNYQIEHHLFPSMPRNKLKEAQQIVKAFCQEHDIAYHETTMIQSFREILQYLHEIGSPLRKASRTAGSL
ncbi:MAG: acyl-CoA desaturase [Ktedonobacteraceae bacterium]|nr:acyl-CoA desaturase [Ktedonobacteraceae bacterium]